MRIHLHLGAHKTATTFIQQRLEKSASLRKTFVAATSHERVRREISDKLDLADAVGVVGKRGLKVALAQIIEEQAGKELVILSDENLCGPMASVEEPGGFYPGVRGRLRKLMKALDGHDVTAFFSVRGYEGFFSSVYAHRAGLGKAADLSVYSARAAALKRGWREVAADIAAEVGPSRLVVWSHEGFVASPACVSDALSGIEGLNLFADARRSPNRSLGRKGLAMLERVSGLLAEGERARFARAIANFEFDLPDTKVEAVRDAERLRLSERYRDDLEAIAALGCRVIGTPPAGVKASRGPALQPAAG